MPSIELLIGFGLNIRKFTFCQLLSKNIFSNQFQLVMTEVANGEYSLGVDLCFILKWHSKESPQSIRIVSGASKEVINPGNLSDDGEV